MIQIDASSFAEFEISEFEILRIDCNGISYVIPVEVGGPALGRVAEAEAAGTAFRVLLVQVVGELDTLVTATAHGVLL